MQAPIVLAVEIRGVNDSFVCAFGNVYGPNVETEIYDFLDLLANLKSKWLVAWVFGGDFKMVRYPFEKKGGNSSSQSQYMELFSDFINIKELIDLPLRGRQFTYSNNKKRSAISRIDKFLLSKEGDDHFEEVIQVALPR